MTNNIPSPEFRIPCGDWKDHLGGSDLGYSEVHGGLGFGKDKPDTEGERVLDYALGFDLAIGNTLFKRQSHLITQI